jgi:succinylarginine dihydrolase
MGGRTLAREVNFDGLVGPTHNFGGLSRGNPASQANRGRSSYPRKAALQGLRKMRRLVELGLLQGVLPPHERPHLPTLRRLGFKGTDREVVESTWKTNSALLINVMSSSAMWAANAATVSPSSDTADRRVHFTPANLGAMFHRSLEAQQTTHLFKKIFADPDHFMHHEPLPYGGRFGDEGAANHNRLCRTYGESGVEIFVYGQSAFHQDSTRRHAPRQAREASESIARLHLLDLSKVVVIQQSVKAIDAGAFHNDVVAVANRSVFFAHEYAFEGVVAWDTIRGACPFEMTILEVKESEVPLDQAVKTTYLTVSSSRYPKTKIKWRLFCLRKSERTIEPLHT